MSSHEPWMTCSVFPSAFILIHWGGPLASRWEGLRDAERVLRENHKGDEPATRGKKLHNAGAGLQRLKDEHRFFCSPGTARPWRRMGGVGCQQRRSVQLKKRLDYQYGKRRLAADRWRQFRFFSRKRIEAAERRSGGPGKLRERGQPETRAFFRGPTVALWPMPRGAERSGEHRRHRRGSISTANHISWVSPLGARVDEVRQRVTA